MTRGARLPSPTGEAAGEAPGTLKAGRAAAVADIFVSLICGSSLSSLSSLSKIGLSDGKSFGLCGGSRI